MVDKESKNYIEVHDKAVKYFVGGADEKYIMFQLAEQGIEDEIIDSVLLDVKKLRKGVKRRRGMKQIFSGAGMIALGIVVANIGLNNNSPIVYFYWGLPVFGVVVTVKGISNII